MENYNYPIMIREFQFRDGVKIYNTYAPYTARFIGWTNEPALAMLECSDGRKRLVPIEAMIADFGYFPKQYLNYN